MLHLYNMVVGTKTCSGRDYHGDEFYKRQKDTFQKEPRSHYDISFATPSLRTRLDVDGGTLFLQKLSSVLSFHSCWETSQNL